MIFIYFSQVFYSTPCTEVLLLFTWKKDYLHFKITSNSGDKEGIHFTKNREGRPSGDAYIEMVSLKVIYNFYSYRTSF